MRALPSVDMAKRWEGVELKEVNSGTPTVPITAAPITAPTTATPTLAPTPTTTQDTVMT